MEKYEELKQVIQKANSEKFNDEIAMSVEDFDVYHGKKRVRYGISLADVLLALDSKLTLDYVLMDGYLEFIGYNDDGMYTAWSWNLQDDKLDNQSDETKQFLIDLLV